jgi:hypothetical protein
MILPELYNQLTAMHGTIMVFLAVVPLSVGFLHDSYASRFQRVARKPTSGTLNDRTSRTFFQADEVRFTRAARPLMLGRTRLNGGSRFLSSAVSGISKGISQPTLTREPRAKESGPPLAQSRG